MCRLLRLVKDQRTRSRRWRRPVVSNVRPYSAAAVADMMGTAVGEEVSPVRTMTVIVTVLALVLSCCGGSGVELDTSEPWDMVFISDSFGLGVARAWTDLIEEAEGVEVRVHNHVVGGLSLVQVREWFTDQEAFREEVADAEIIFVFGNPEGVFPDDSATCKSTSKVRRDPPEHNTPGDLAPYGDVLRDILDVIVELRAGQPTVIRVADYFAGQIAAWREAGIEAECTAGWEAWAGVIREAADEYGVATASWYDAFNGPNHDEDPREKGYIAVDGFHQSQDAGVAAQADVLHALGYDPIVP